MFRSSSRAAALAGAAATLVALPAGAAAQSVTAPVSDLTLPVVDMQLPTASLDGDLRRVETEGEIRLTLDAGVLFAFDEARLSGEARQGVEAVAREIGQTDPETVTVEGHTDSKGSDGYNERLSQRRAQSVRDALASELGGDAPRFEVSGRGESEPAASNAESDGSDDPEGRARNRRVEIRIPK
jgi:outer membrane protein OmpA-like peptidoglycan-associated protein